MFIGITPTILRPSLLSAILKPQDVFATSLYTGNSSGQKIILPFAPDFVWTKAQNTTNAHFIFDKLRGARNYLSSNTTDAEVLATSGFALLSFDVDGFTLGKNFNGENGAGTNEATWSWKRAPKFFDIVTWTGDGTSNRQIPHGLGVVPGMVIVKARSDTQNWPGYHRSLDAGQSLFLNLTNAAGTGGITATSATTFTVANFNSVNGSGITYVAYLIAHDPSADGIVQCGASTSDANGAFTIPHGWAGGAQWVLIKRTDAAADWRLFDTARTPGFSGGDAYLAPNTSAAESATDWITQSGGVLTITQFANAAYVWTVIRAPY